LGQAAFGQIPLGPVTGGRAQLPLIPFAGQLHDLLQGAAALGPLGVFGAFLGDFHPRHTGDLLDRLHELQPVIFHKEFNDITVRPTGKAMVEALLVNDVERRFAVTVERAEGDKFPPSPFKLQLATDHA
jgi:hypothetical protein